MLMGYQLAGDEEDDEDVGDARQREEQPRQYRPDHALRLVRILVFEAAISAA